MSVESSEIIYSYQQTEDYDEIRGSKSEPFLVRYHLHFANML